MKNSIKIFSIVALIGMALSFSSCSKCTTCTYTDPNGMVNLEKETCGSKSDSDANKDNCLALATSGGGICECITKFKI